MCACPSANAGTHNHRQVVFAKGRLTAFLKCGAAAYGSRLKAGTTLRGSLPATTANSFPRLRHLLDPARHHAPNRSPGRKRCSRSMKRASLPIRMRGWFFSMPCDDAQRGGFRRGLRHRVEPLDRLRAARVVGHAGAGAGIAGDVGGNAAGMHHREPDRARRHLQLVPQAFRKAAHREFRRGIRGLPRRRDDAEDAGEVDDVGLALARQDAAGTRGSNAPRPRN